MKSGETLTDIQADYPDKFSYDSLRNHVKKHQFLSEKDFTDRHLNRIVKKAEKDLVKRAIESSKVWDRVIDQGMEDLESGELKVTTNHLLKAAKDKQDYEFKKKDHQLAMMEMVYHFASGESNQELSRPYDREVVSSTSRTINNKDRGATDERRTIIEGATVTNNHPPEGTADGAGPGAHQPRGIHYPPAWDATT